MVVPSPSCPYSLYPQHLTPPLVVRAQVCSPPLAIATTPLVKPLTLTGVVWSVVVPSPSWPYLFHPQHLTPPSRVTTQVWAYPAARAVTPLVSPCTSTGVTR